MKTLYKLTMSEKEINKDQKEIVLKEEFDLKTSEEKIITAYTFFKTIKTLLETFDKNEKAKLEYFLKKNNEDFRKYCEDLKNKEIVAESKRFVHVKNINQN